MKTFYEMCQIIEFYYERWPLGGSKFIQMAHDLYPPQEAESISRYIHEVDKRIQTHDEKVISVVVNLINAAINAGHHGNGFENLIKTYENWMTREIQEGEFHEDPTNRQLTWADEKSPDDLLNIYRILFGKSLQKPEWMNGYQPDPEHKEYYYKHKEHSQV